MVGLSVVVREPKLSVPLSSPKKYLGTFSDCNSNVESDFVSRKDSRKVVVYV